MAWTMLRSASGDYGRPGNYFERQIIRWTRQYEVDELAGRDPDMDALVAWLPTAIPAGDETTIVHGDFRCDNMIFHPTEPRILAVLDRELSTLGHPLADFAYHAMMYRMPPDIVAERRRRSVALGLPGEADYIATYCARTGPRHNRPLGFLHRLPVLPSGGDGRDQGRACCAAMLQRAGGGAGLPSRLTRLARDAMEACT
jgi:aminoglycoside phosphotransferase (APT) family kinase protein